MRLAARYSPVGLVISLAVILSLGSCIYFYNQGVITAYNDARSHLNLARLVIDNLRPGVAQLGGVWLPLQHLLMLPFIWHDGLWHTGLAGSIVSMISYVLSGYILYRLGYVLSNRAGVGIAMALVFLLNANILYMQAIPMSESLLLLFFLLTAFTLVRWVQTTAVEWLVACALSLLGASLTRYDGWFLLVWTAVTVAVILLHDSRHRLRRHLWQSLTSIEGKVVLFVTLASSGIVFWFLWNMLIFGDPFFFALGPYSARAQQRAIQAAGALPTAGNLVLSLKAYTLAVVNTIELPLIVMSLLGLMAAMGRKRSFPLFAALSILLSPWFFHVLSLVAGNSIVVVPELNIHNPLKPTSAWFNVRYGLMMLPAVAVFSTYWLKTRWLQIGIVIVALLQASIFFATDTITTLIDGTRGTSSLTVGDVATYLKRHASGSDEKILTSIAFNNALAFETGLPLKQFVHEGTAEQWQGTLSHPYDHVEWIVMSSGDVGDRVYDAMIKQKNPQFARYFSPVYRGAFTTVYERTEHVIADGPDLKYKGTPFRFIGVNSYDLLYRTPSEIEATIRAAGQNGITVIRFWAFGENFPGAISPRSGGFDEERAQVLDRVLATAAKHDVKLIVTLANNWPDYGGLPQYLAWLGLPNNTSEEREKFFSHPDAKHLYKNYVEKIVNRVSTVTGKPYKDDPVILAWELMNEPRSATRDSQAIIANWLQEMYQYLRILDSNHLIMSGVEGFDDAVYADPAGPDVVVGNTSSDIVSLHLYRHHLTDQGSDTLRKAITGRGERVAALHKPVIIGEVGFSKEEGDRTHSFNTVFEAARTSLIDGVLLWNWSLTPDTSFGVSPRDAGDQELLDALSHYSQRLTPPF